MTNNAKFIDKLNTFLFGQAVPVLDQNELQIIQQLDDKLEAVLALLEKQQSRPEHSPETSSGAPASATIDDLAGQVRKLAKTQFKANTLQSEQLLQQQQTMAELQKQLTETSQQRQQALELTRLELLKTLLPILDSLDAAFNSGRRQVLKLAMPPATRQAVVAWLDGIRLARLRLLDVLKAYHVSPIPAVGEAFDPNLHVAVATDTNGQAADGLIIREDRRGYATPNSVLRYAEVVVARSK